MQAGTNVAWTAEDEEGTFTVKGQVVSITDGRVLLNSEIGLISFPEDDGAMKPAREVKGLTAVSEAPKPKAKPVAKAGSKKALAIKLFADTAELPSRKDGIKQIVEALSVSAAYASTLFNDVKKSR